MKPRQLVSVMYREGMVLYLVSDSDSIMTKLWIAPLVWV